MLSKSITLMLLVFSSLVFSQNNSMEANELLENRSSKTFFIENKGQWPEEVKYLAEISGMNAWITDKGVVYDYYKIERNFNKKDLQGKPEKEKERYEREHTTIKGHVIRTSFVGGNERKEFTGENKQTGYYNYFIGSDRSKWASFVPLYGSVEVEGVYEGIDVIYYFDEGLLRYDYRVKPGADPSRIKMGFEGADGIRINERGELIVSTSLGDVTHGEIYSYQEKKDGEEREVNCRFELEKNGTVALKIIGYDKTKELIIDPLIYSTYFGGGVSEEGYSLAFDSEGNAYVSGYTTTFLGFPITSGAYQTSNNGFGDAFITKLNSTGSDLVYSTYLGGQIYDYGYSIAIDSEGNAYIAGGTSSTDFPITSGVFQTSLGLGYYAAFITKLNPTGSDLVYSTFLGGSRSDVAYSLAIDIDRNAYVTGSTSSSDFPVTSGAFQTGFSGGAYDAFITKLNSTGTGLLYSTYLGGSEIDEGHSLKVDIDCNAYVTGSTSSSDFPVTSGAFQTSFGEGDYDSYITKLNSDGSTLVYSTFLGGDGNDYGVSLALNSEGNAYVTGSTTSPNFPTTSDAFQTSFGEGGYLRTNAFITKLDSIGSDLVYSTFLGGDGNNDGVSLALDSEGNVYVTGSTTSPNFPTTSDAFQTSYNGGYDAFVTKLSLTDSVLVYSTYLGGTNNDQSNFLVLDTEDNAYVTGLTESSDFPTTSDAFQTYKRGCCDAFITKISLIPTGVKDNNNKPSEYLLLNNYPNPFNPTTVIKYSLPEISYVKVEIYNILGERVAELVNGSKQAGYEKINWNAGNLPSGVYLIKMEARALASNRKYTEVKKAVLLK